MTRTIPLRRLVALAAGLLLAGRVAAVPLPVVLTEHVDRDTLSLSIDEEALRKAPEWQPGQGPLPLPVADMVARLHAWAREFLPRYARIEIREILLKPIESPAYGTHWHYLVVFRGVTRAGRVDPTPHVAAVLLDGRVVPGVLEPRP